MPHTRPVLIYLFLLAAITLIPSCGSGTLASIWENFPASAFDGESEGDDGDRPDIPGAFEPLEVSFLDVAQGVDGETRNIDIAEVGGRTLAFLSADTTGLHVIDVTTPESLTASELLATVPAARFAGDRVDMVRVVGGVFLVCGAVGTNSGGNSVTVLNLLTLDTLLGTANPDFDQAIVPLVGGGIRVDGDNEGTSNDQPRAGGIAAGPANSFFVATGSDTLGSALITTGATTSWAALPAFTPDSPVVEKFIDVIASGTTVVASVFSGGSYGILSMTVDATTQSLSVNTDPALIIAGNFSRYTGNSIGGPGSWALDLAVEGPLLFVGGDDQIETFAISSPTTPIPGDPLLQSGVDTVNIVAAGGAIAATSGRELVVFQTLGGASTSVRFEFSGLNLRARGVALRTTATGRYAIVAGGGRGLRVVQWSNLPG